MLAVPAGAPRRRIGQIEMLGLVFIIVLLVLGILLYVRVKSIDAETAGTAMQSAQAQEAASTYMTALKGVSVVSCNNVELERVAAACLGGEYYLCPSDPCDALQDTLTTIANWTLARQGLAYNLSLNGTGVMNYTCASMNATIRRAGIASVQQADILIAGGGRGRLILTMCR